MRENRKNKLEVHCDLYKVMAAYQKEIQLVRNDYFSNINTENAANSEQVCL